MSTFIETIRGSMLHEPFEEPRSIADYDEPLSTNDLAVLAARRATALYKHAEAKRNKLEQERKLLLSFASVCFLFGFYLILSVSFSGLNESQANASVDTARLDQVLTPLVNATAPAQATTATREEATSDELLGFERSRITPVFDQPAIDSETGSEIESNSTSALTQDRYQARASGTELSYYGEELPLDDILKAERRGQVPHSQNQGRYIGDPVATRDERINAIIRDRLPLNATEQLYIKKLIDDQERIDYAMPDIEQRTLKLTYSDGEIPTITVAKSNLSTISFIDKFGNPFPISDISPKSAGDLFDTHLIDNDGTHANIAKIEGKVLNGTSNLSVTLIGRTLPALFKINMSQTLNDARVIVQLNTAAPGFEHVSMPESNKDAQLCKADQVIESILSGIVPASVEPVETGIQNLQAFKTNEHHYIRSQHQIVDPDCDCLVYGVDNLNVCKQSNTIPNVLYVDRHTEQFQTLAFVGAGDIL